MTAAGHDPGRLGRALAQAAEQFAVAGSPLYAALARVVAADPALLAIAAEVPRGQLVGGLLMAAVHFEVLARPHEPLAGWFRSVTDSPRDPALAGPAFRAFCLAHRDAIVHDLRTRPLQTTSPVRATAVLPALARVVPEDASLVELGCGAGFNLAFDAFRHRYLRDGQVVFVAGDARSDVTLECELRPAPHASLPADGPVPFAMPRFAARAGIDLRPPDLDDDAERRWLLALGFPEHTGHARQLHAALEVRRRTAVRIERGDAVAELPRLAASLPGALCVLHVNCLYQWTPERREALEAWLLGESRRRGVHRVGMERLHPLPEALRRLATPGSIPPCDLVHVAYAGGRAERRLLGYAEGFGRWLEWHGSSGHLPGMLAPIPSQGTEPSR